MPINVSTALDADTCVLLTVERANDNAGTYVDGIYVPAPVTTFKSLMSPQQPSPEMLDMLPSGERDKNIMLFISKRRLRTADNANNLEADIVLFDGGRWRIIQLGNWSTFGQTHAFGAKL